MPGSVRATHLVGALLYFLVYMKEPAPAALYVANGLTKIRLFALRGFCECLCPTGEDILINTACVDTAVPSFSRSTSAIIQMGNLSEKSDILLENSDLRITLISEPDPINGSDRPHP